MGFLFLSILASTIILILFRYFEKLNIRLLPAITFNYLTASAIALFISGPSRQVISGGFSSWMYLAFLIGVIFLIMFILIGKTTQEAGITTTSIASRMSVMIPMLFSIIYYGEPVSALKITGLALAPLSVILVVYRQENNKSKKSHTWLPIIVFFGVGLTDSLVKYTQQDHLVSAEVITFSGYLFFVSMVSAFLVLIISSNRPWFTKYELAGGILLGACNLGSLYFFIQALNHSGLDSSVVFGINSTGIVLLSTGAGYVFFRESLSPLNAAGLSLAVIALIILFYL